MPSLQQTCGAQPHRLIPELEEHKQVGYHQDTLLIPCTSEHYNPPHAQQKEELYFHLFLMALMDPKKNTLYPYTLTTLQ